jgi:hypothetical protein
MEDDRPLPVSPRHTVVLAKELYQLVERPPRQDFVVRTLARRDANGLPLMTAEMVVASARTRQAHPGADAYPLHFRKTYFPGRLHGDPAEEFAAHSRAAELSTIPPPIGHEPDIFRSCFLPGQPYGRLSPFGADPPDSNIATAQQMPLATAAGLWRLAEEILAQHLALHEGGLAHGDAQLHNCIVCPSPLEALLIDFEAAVHRDAVSAAEWERRRALDLEPLLREATYLQCALGRQPGPLADLAWTRLDQLFAAPDRFRAAIVHRADL